MPELEHKTFQKRQIAYKLNIADLLNNGFVKDGLSAGYLQLKNISVSRVNVIATLVYKSEQDANPIGIIDDGTGKIMLRAFDNRGILSKTDVGDVILIIGKIREYNNERYLIPEIVKKLDNEGWVNVRKFEVSQSEVTNVSIDTKTPLEVAANNSYEEIYLLIKNLDRGEGVAIEEIIKSSDKGSEAIINRLLENGDIFEVRPGKLKVLE